MSIKTQKRAPTDLKAQWKALASLDREELKAIDDSRATVNAFNIRLIASLVAPIFFAFWLGTLTGILVPIASPYRPYYLWLFGAEAAVACAYLAARLVWPAAAGHGLYLGVSLIGVVGLNLIGMRAVGDRSIYLMALMSCALMYSAPLRWYVIVFSLTWAASVAGMLIWFPGSRVVNDSMVLATIAALSTATGLAVEIRRATTSALASRLERINSDLLEISVRDPLTGLYNRRYLREWLAKAIARAEREGRESRLTVALIDLDGLKAINDGAGHASGDAVLRAAADTLRTELRLADVIARYGGDEYIVAMTGSSHAQGLQAIERCLAAFSKVRIPSWDRVLGFSCGLAAWRAGMDPDELITRADENLYRAKKQGRNRMVDDRSAPLKDPA